MPVKVYIDSAALKAKLERGRPKIEKAVAEQIVADSTPFVPDDGENILRSSVKVEEILGHWAATWDTPYAAFQYYGCWPDGTHVVHKHTTPGTTIQWTETARRKYGKTWQQVAQNAEEKL